MPQTFVLHTYTKRQKIILKEIHMNMKKIIALILLVLTIQTNAQSKSIFSKDPIINLENFQKQNPLWVFLGFNSFDFKIDYKTVGPDIQTKKKQALM
jgi:ABC-type transport system involved in multi-copper enzyme maturation permease subunit